MNEFVLAANLPTFRHVNEVMERCKQTKMAYTILVKIFGCRVCLPGLFSQYGHVCAV